MTSFRDFYYTLAHGEIWGGRDAEAAGNPEDVIYFAEKASFFAISCWMEYHDIEDDIKDGDEPFESCLRCASEYPSVPYETREALKRLLDSYKSNIVKSQEFNPLDDAEKIIEYFLNENNL